MPLASEVVPIVSVNANSWTTLSGFLEGCKAMVVFAQELKLVGEAVQEASAKALRMGWRCLLTVAAGGPKGVTRYVDPA